MIRPSYLRAIGLMLIPVGVVLAFLGLSMRGNPKQEALNVFLNPNATDVMGQLNAIDQRIEASPYVLWSGVALAVLGLILWIVGYLKASDAEIVSGAKPGHAGNVAGEEGNGWRFKDIEGVHVIYRHTQDGTHQISVEGNEQTFDTFDQLRDYVANGKQTQRIEAPLYLEGSEAEIAPSKTKWRSEIDRLSGKTFQYRKVPNGTYQFSMYGETRTFAALDQLREYARNKAHGE